MARTPHPLIAIVLSLAAGGTGRGDEIVFPADSGVIDVTQAPYHAKGDGVTDDTKALQAAILDHMAGGILYFPAGTYLVSSTLQWAKTDSQGRECWGNVTIQGQGVDSTTIRLKDATFTNPENPQTIMACGGFGSADWFHNYVKDITFDTGRGNPGAIGLQFYSNNTGGVRDVRIVSGDGEGAIGLDLAHRDMNGPLLVKNVRIEGFAIGVRAGWSVNSQTLEHIRIEGASDCGLLNGGQSLAVRGLTVVGAPLAVRNAEGGLLTLVDSTFEGAEGSPAEVAIDNQGALFARNVSATGYRSALKTTRGGYAGDTSIDEFISEPVLSLFPSTGRSLNLPVQETPEVPRDPVDAWANVRDFHVGGEDWSPAIQKAIDSGATTIYFPVGAYRIGPTVIVRGDVRRLVGLNAWLAEAPGEGFEDQPRFRVEDGAAPVVAFENFRGGFGGRVFIEHDSSRTLVVRECSGIPSRFRGTGEVYLEDITGSPYGGIFVFEGRDQKVWARQFNVEAFVDEAIPATLDNRGSDVWILGLKTEQGNRLVATRDGGRTEILGGLVYTVTAHDGRPAFLNEDSSLSMSILERCFIGTPMNPVVRETQQGQTRVLNPTAVIGLYVGAPDNPGASSAGSPTR